MKHTPSDPFPGDLGPNRGPQADLIAMSNCSTDKYVARIWTDLLQSYRAYLSDPSGMNELHGVKRYYSFKRMHDRPSEGAPEGT